MRPIYAALILGILQASPAPGQTVAVQGDPPDPAVVLLRELIGRGDYVLIQRDTTLAADEVVERDVLITEARVSVEGRITGSVAVVDGELFVRPRAVVDGAIIVLGTGGAYPSGLATTGPITTVHPRYDVGIVRDDATVTVIVSGPPGPGMLRLPRLYGLTLPTYDRVNGLSVGWGAMLAGGGRDTATATLAATTVFRTARGRFDGALEASYRPTPRSLLNARIWRGTRTTEGWIRGDLANSISALGIRSDVRDYFDTEEAAITFARTPPPPLIEGEGFVAPRVVARVSRDRSVPASDPWTFFGRGQWRENPPIDEGVLASLVAGADAGWRGRTATFTASAGAEWAPAGVGDFSFAQFSALGSWSMQALYQQQISVRGYALFPLGGEAPLQRWSYVGGSGTLPAHDLASMRGDHVLFLHSVLLAPIQRITLPLAGNPALRLEHAVGGAWRSGDQRPPLEQNLGIGVQLLVFHAVVVVDPVERPRRATFSVGGQLPGAAVLPIF